MTAVADALAEMRLDQPGAGDRYVASLDKQGKIKQWRASEVMETNLAEIGENVYVTTARYKPGTERKAENAQFIDALPFDADLKDYLRIPKEDLYGWTDEQLTEAIESLVTDVRETFAQAHIPIHQITYTGYGIGLLTRIHPDDTPRTSDLIALHKNLVSRINTLYGGSLVDPAVSDAGSRLIRLVGHFNHKGPQPRATRVIADFPGTARIDQFEINPSNSPRQPVPQSAIPRKVLENDALTDIALAVNRIYAEGDRHAISLAIPAMLCKAGVSQEQAEDLLWRWAVDDEEYEDRLRALQNTYKRQEEGKSIAGFMALRYRIPKSVLDYVDGKLSPRPPTVAVAPEEEDVDIETPGYASPPESAYYGWFADYRRLMAPCTSGADSFHLASSLVYAGASVGRQISVQQAGTHYPNLMVVLVGETGRGKKDTCANYARELFSRQVRDGTAMTPMPYNILSDLSTSEGLAAFLNATSPRCMVHTSEFNQLINKARRDVGGGIMPMLQKVWDGAEYYDVPTRTNPIRVERPSVSLLGTITPAILARYMSVDDIQSGFANRVLWVYGTGKGWIASPPRPDTGEQIRLVHDFCQKRDAIIAQKPELGKTPAFMARWSEWSHDLYYREYDNEDDQHLAERLEANAIRVSALFCISDGRVDLGVDHLDAAIAFVEWCFAHTRKEARLWGSDDETLAQEHILECLRVKPRDSRELFYRLKRYSAGLLRKAIDDLYGLGVIERDKNLRWGLVGG